MFSFRKTLPTALCAAAFLFFAACSDGSDEPVFSASSLTPKTVAKTYLAVSDGLSPYTQSAMKAFSYVQANQSAVPDLFIVKGADLSGLSNDNIAKAFETSLKGGTVLIDAPTSAQLTAFKTKVDAYFAAEDGAVLGQRVLAANDSFYDILNQFALTAGDTATSGTGARQITAGGKQANYEAVGSRGRQIYFVHDVDETLEASAKQTPAASPAKFTQTGEGGCTEQNPVTIPVQTPSTDWETVTKSSVSNFANWVNGGGASLLASRPADTTKVSTANTTVKADSRPAQTFVHNFTATYNYSYEHYDGRYNGKAESVEVIIDVWAACEIKDTVDFSKDWYLVRTSVVCNNQQLGCKNDWDSAKHVGPFFNFCDISSAIAESTVKTNECSPQNAAGSTSFTTGTSFSLSGNVGFNMSGPTGGVGVGYSESQSSTRSIPDIAVTWNGTEAHKASWKYESQRVTPYWSWFTTHCDNPKDIQTKAAVFDAYTLYNLASDKSYTGDAGKVRLETYVRVGLSATVGWIESLVNLWYCYLDLNWHITYNDYIQKPSNTFKEYIMSFKAPDGVTPEQADRLHAIVKEYISYWNSVEKYYAVGTANLDPVAKNYFANAKKKITDNKNVLQGRGFKGTFKFYINKVEGGGLVDSFDLTF